MRSYHSFSHASRVAGMLALCSVAGVIAACAHGMSAARTTSSTVKHQKSVFVNVENDSFDDMRVYLVLHTVPMPLGWVPSYTTRRLRIWPSQLGTGMHIRLVAGLPGEPAPRHSTQVFDAEPGQVIDWQILEEHTVTTAVVRW